jgi:hypothetical protein
MLMLNFFKDRREKKDIAIKEFLHQHLSDKLVIILDPKDDSLYMKYGKNYVLTHIKSADGKDYRVVKNVLRHSRFKSHIDRLIGGMAEAMQLPIKHGNQFYHWLDGSLFNISKQISLSKKETYATSKKDS